MQISGYNDVLGSGEVKIPENIKADTQEEKDLYRATLEFERFFVSSLLKKMDESSKMLSEGSEKDEAGVGGSTGGYQDMARDQMTQAVLDGGGLGLASVMYGQMRERLLGTAPTPAAGAAS